MHFLMSWNQDNMTDAIYLLTPDAQSDLIEIRRYTIAQWGIEQSKKYISELRKTIQLLAESPTLGAQRPEVGTNVLSFPCASHVIYYFMRDSMLIAFGILHKRMVPFSHLARRKNKNSSYWD